MAHGPRATIAQRQVANRIRMYRLRAKKTQEEAAMAFGCAVWKIRRMEAGKVAATAGDVRELAVIYGLDARETEALVGLAKGAKARGFTSTLDSMPQGLTLLVGLEAQASTMKDYSASYVTGLLQTPDYIRAIIRADPDVPEDSVEPLVDFRLSRQQLLGAENSLKAQFLVHEAALRTRIGPPQLMQDQLNHLVELNESEAVTIRIWPFEAGLHPLLAAPFIVMGFDDPADPDVVYLENHLEARYLEIPTQVHKFEMMFTDAFDQAQPIKEFRP
ncbi:helix-turn-helix domain-containing protein [Kineosporia mesophila]|nr:helix-turn-helix transcriptional regulator [Kineosporia mesophila]MCD5353533.1 helix-turn-helix domain-containing protein [Kineosporia mesophila]